MRTTAKQRKQLEHDHFNYLGNLKMQGAGMVEIYGHKHQQILDLLADFADLESANAEKDKEIEKLRLTIRSLNESLQSKNHPPESGYKAAERP